MLKESSSALSSLLTEPHNPVLILPQPFCTIKNPEAIKVSGLVRETGLELPDCSQNHKKSSIFNQFGKALIP